MQQADIMLSRLKITKHSKNRHTQTIKRENDALSVQINNDVLLA